MADYRNKVTGSLVSVADALVLGTDYELIGKAEKPAGKSHPAKKTVEVEESAEAEASK